MSEKKYLMAVVEDDDADAEFLMKYLERYAAESGRTFEIKRFGNALDFIGDYRPVYDVVFFDIVMPHMTGMEAAKRIRAIDDGVAIIFVTNMEQYAVQGYDVSAMYFILKPVEYADFKDKIARATSYIRDRGDKVPLMVNDDYGTTVRIFASNVYYVLKYKNHVYFHGSEGVYKKRELIRDTMKKLRDLPFFMINSGCGINLDYLDEISQKTVKVKGELFTVARNRKKEFTDAYMRYLGGERRISDV